MMRGPSALDYWMAGSLIGFALAFILLILFPPRR